MNKETFITTQILWNLIVEHYSTQAGLRRILLRWITKLCVQGRTTIIHVHTTPSLLQQVSSENIEAPVFGMFP